MNRTRAENVMRYEMMRNQMQNKHLRLTYNSGREIIPASFMETPKHSAISYRNRQVRSTESKSLS